MKAIATTIQSALPRLDPEALLMKAVESGQGVETLERLLALRERLQDEAAATQYRQALLAFQDECPKIQKSQEVRDKAGEVRYRYATLESIQDVTKPILHRCGFSYDFDTVCEGGAVTVIMTISHIAGHERQSRFRVPIDPKSYMSEPQKYESAMSFAQRICFRNGFGIVTGTNDDNTENGRKPEPPQPEPRIGKGSQELLALEFKIAEFGLSIRGVEEWTSRHWQVFDLSDLTPTQQQELLNRLPEFAIRKLMKVIPNISKSEAESLVRHPPVWLSRFPAELEAALEAAQARLETFISEENEE